MDVAGGSDCRRCAAARLLELFDMLFGCAFGALLIWISFGYYLVSDDIVHTYNVHKYIELAPASERKVFRRPPY